MSKYILDVNLSFDFELIGIASALPGYRVAWLLNTKLSLKLSRIKDIIIKLDDPVVTGELSFDNVHQKERRFSRYVYEIEEEEADDLLAAMESVLRYRQRAAQAVRLEVEARLVADRAQHRADTGQGWAQVKGDQHQTDKRQDGLPGFELAHFGGNPILRD